MQTFSRKSTVVSSFELSARFRFKAYLSSIREWTKFRDYNWNKLEIIKIIIEKFYSTKIRGWEQYVEINNSLNSLKTISAWRKIK